MRVLILSQYYKPEPVPKPSELAEALSLHGDDVTVITGFPNYPTGKLYSTYRLALLRGERIDGVRVLRTFEYPYHGTRATGRFLNYVSFMLSAPLGSLLAPRQDAIYVWHPPLTIGVSAWIIARLRGIPFIYDVQDIWPEAAVLSGMLKPGWVVSCLAVLERAIYRRADHLLVVTDGAKANLVSKGVPANKISVMPHWFDVKSFETGPRRSREEVRSEEGWDGKCVLLFAGNIGLVQGLETLIRAAELLRPEPWVRFVFIGDGADKGRLESLVSSLSLQEKVQFVGRQPPENMPSYMAAADGLIVHLKHSPLSNYVIPTKTLAYLASGTPIVMAMHGAAAKMVEEAGAGIVVPPENPAQLASAIRKLAALPAGEAAAMGQRGREYVRRNLAKEVVIPRYRAILERLARR